ncbi:phosphoglycolate phosphatase-like HAD superfamily hydrolase [Lutibacter sp. Hel_I_33_5]|uniref:HAD family hydrolase n=1 Tax=Lutibacter sp. Hel_I_33_5 TaxID=1566289 RepID=UPI0011A8AB06|nr:HAD family hydrolase [Lutibacter sp. Hel_I_33_5]TVZ55883.1 phosphoglycolate phosphatase-like HAD superfamily hydrolase [Lutibacter sp. Hel_I_33_5]
MGKENLIIFDIDDTLTKSENQHLESYVKTMQDFGITNINKDWKNYKNVTDSYVLKKNFEANFDEKFELSFIPNFEEKMIKNLLGLTKTKEIAGASNIIDFFLNETNYAICFATGSLLKPAIIKLEQANVNFIPEVVEASNELYTREEIVSSAMEKAKKYFKVDDFKNIISVGDGIWDLRTAKNLGVHFLGIRDKNLADFKKESIKSHISDWTQFDFQKIKQELQII